MLFASTRASLQESPPPDQAPPLEFVAPPAPVEDFAPAAGANPAPRPVILSEVAAVLNAATNAVGQQTADARIVALTVASVPAGNTPRCVVGALASAGVGGASDARLVWTVADAVVRGPAVVIDATAGVLPRAAAPGLQHLADTTSNLALPLAATPLPPVLADLLTPTAVSSGPLLALQNLWPTEAELETASLFTRLLRSPYLPGAVVVLGTLELFRRRLRRRRMATELPEITGPVGL